MDRKSPAFVAEYLSPAQGLIASYAMKELLFSRGTYQLEIQEKGKKKVFPFIQMKDDGEVTDFFCSCSTSESGLGCAHLAASYLKIFDGTDEPLHIRFKRSFWNRLLQMASKRHGYGVECIQKGEDGSYFAESKEKNILFSIHPITEKGGKKLEAILENRPAETEETSIKFSNLPLEEIEAYRAGHPSHTLRYELSFWSDLAKYMMAEEKYEILFAGDPLPHSLRVLFKDYHLFVHIFEVNWPWIIPSLATVRSPLQVFDEEDASIEKVVYDEILHSFLVTHRSKEECDAGVPMGDWNYKQGVGFYRHRRDPFLEASLIGPERVALTLSHSTKLLSQFISIHAEKKKCQYYLHFDRDLNFHIELYVEAIGDMQSHRAACFFPWVYVPDKGFYELFDWFHEEKEKVILRAEVADFINRHRVWLHHFPGFTTHLGSLESHLTYRLSDQEQLIFDAELNFPENYEETHHFDEWVYIKGQGFYIKKESRARLPLHPGLKIPKEAVSEFLASHKEELEQVHHFYTDRQPIRHMGLNVSLSSEGLITLSPHVEYAPDIDPRKLRRFGDFYYLEGEGFFEIPSANRLPERYAGKVEIQASQELAFLAYELEPLKRYILNIDPRLVVPKELKLKIHKIIPSKRKKGKEWFLDLAYDSEIGRIDVFSIWEALQQKKRHLFSRAGLLYLKEPRFSWIRQLSKKRLDQKKGLIRLSTLEWIRLSVFEQIEEPEEPEMKQFLEELNRLETDRTLDISRLKATLRPYQEEGLKWLWFLYSHGLSGLLCDDMGLGKTHQAMALLASVFHEDEERQNKYIVICPTSVIYHWQELLGRFLPEVRVLTFYGHERTLSHFEEEYDLLLTSYGIMRTGKENLRAYRFEIAIYDEIQIAKNHVSQTHKALRAIQAEMRLGLTGTPIENRIRELKSLIDVVLPSYMPPDPIFRDLFVNPIEKHQDQEKKELLGHLVKPFLLRRKKGDVLKDLPEKIEEIAYADLSEEQKKLYRDMAIRMKHTIVSDLKDRNKPIPFVHIFSALSTLKQICNHPALVLDDVHRFHKHSSGKWDLFVELMQEAYDSGQKVVVFSQYLDMLKIIESYLKKKGIGFAGIKGSTKNRPEQLRRFREDPECFVFVASLLAAGVGIDLTVASIVIHYDRWWNPAKENQATDSVHRIGQNRGVQVFKLVTKNTIEEHIHGMIERKKGLLEDIIGTEDQIHYLTREELIEVLEKMELP